MNCDVKKLRCASLRSALQRCGALRPRILMKKTLYGGMTQISVTKLSLVLSLESKRTGYRKGGDMRQCARGAAPNQPQEYENCPFFCSSVPEKWRFMLENARHGYDFSIPLFKFPMFTLPQRSPAKGVWQKGDEKSDRSIRKSDQKVTGRVPE